MQFLIENIGIVHSPYTQKFGIPRQPDLVPAAEIIIELKEQFGLESVRGLDEFDYIWVQFIFHDAINEGWAQMVRPPRLGGKKKMGVFATRSPHRPNHIGLSLLKLNKITFENQIVKLHCGGADLLHGTPIIDIKPYIPFVEAKPDVASGFVQGAPELLAVEWSPESGAECLNEQTKLLIEQSLAQDPRPAYQDIPERIYGMELAGVDVQFHIQENKVLILNIKKITQ